MMKGCVQMGVAPDITMPIELNPVDMCARAINEVAVHRGHHQAATIFHLHNPDMVPCDVVDSLRRHGYTGLRLAPYVEWRKLVMGLTDKDHNALMPLVPQFSPEFESDVASVERYAVHNAAEMLRDSIRHGTIDKARLLHLYVGYLVRTQFLPKP
jgi:thioester reductase-like protein